MREFWRGTLAVLSTAALAAVAIGGDYAQDGWHGRTTTTAIEYEAVRYTLSDSAIRTASQTRLAADNDLVDFGGAVHQAVPGGWEVHVYLNFEPDGAATPQGDIETLVFVNTLGEAEYFVTVDDPTAIDDPVVPGAGMQVNDEWEYDAVVEALNDADVISCAADRFGAGVWWFDTNADLIKAFSTYRKIEVTLVFLNPDESDPGRGLRNIISKVRVEEDLSSSTVLQVQCK